MRDDRMNHIQGEIQRLENLKLQLREREKSLKAKEIFLNNPRSFGSSNVQAMRHEFMNMLPNYMMPGNVGGITEVTWPFLFNVNIDFGDNPTIADDQKATGFYQVDQEAAFLIMGMTRSHSTDENGASATILAPIQLDFIDRQSTRRFSSSQVPLQTISQNSIMTIFPTPMYMMPNAVMDVIATGIPPAANPQEFTGSGAFQISFFGNRIRTEDAGKVLSTIFGRV